MIHFLKAMLLSLLIVSLSSEASHAQTAITELCPASGIAQRPAVFEPGGIIITPFDGANMWVYDIDRTTRYPLPQTSPCAGNCRLSPDARWLSFLNADNFIYSKMRLNGTQRTPLASGASDVEWWSATQLLIWTPDHRAYLRVEADAAAEPQFLPVQGIRSVQPNGFHALQINREADGSFSRYMVNLNDPVVAPIALGPERTYFNAASWSPDGRYLAYAGPAAFDESVGIMGAELFIAQPNSAIPQQATFLSSSYGAVRINGYAPGELSWSPDSRYIAFWVIELLGSNVEANTGNAVIHLLDVATLQLVRFCGFGTPEHTPNPSRLVWSPDGTHIAFAGNVPEDGKGALLLALDISNGQLTELSNGIFPAYGIADVTAWGYAP